MIRDYCSVGRRLIDRDAFIAGAACQGRALSLPAPGCRIARQVHARGARVMQCSFPGCHQADPRGYDSRGVIDVCVRPVSVLLLYFLPIVFSPGPVLLCLGVRCFCCFI